jgi:hypothetical protein
MPEVLPVVDAASWRIAAEVCRRTPELLIRHLHPGGGQYDCLALIHPGLGSIAHLNRVGRLHVMMRLDGRRLGTGPTDVWPQLMKQNPRGLVDLVSKRIGQAVPKRLVATTPRVLTYRLIAAVVGMQIFASRVWTCRSAVHDSSGMDGTFVDSALRRFVIPKRELFSREESARLEQGYSFWLIWRSSSALACLCEDGRAWTSSGSELELVGIYRKHRRIMPLLLQLVGDHLD